MQGSTMASNSSLALAEPMLQSVASRSACYNWKVLTLLSLFGGLSLAVVSLPGIGGELEPTTMAWQYMQPAKVSKSSQPSSGQSMQPMKSSPFVQKTSASADSALPGLGLEPKQVEQGPYAILEGTNSRRSILSAAAAAALAMMPVPQSLAAQAPAVPKNIFVAGATGRVGRRVLGQLVDKDNLNVIGGVRNINKATKALAATSYQGETQPSVDPASVTLAELDVVKEPVETITEALKGVDALVISIGFVPSDPFSQGWDKAAKAVDDVGTIKLIDAAKTAGVNKVVMVSSILTDASAWGQQTSSVYRLTNFFGGVLDQKLVAEKYLRSSGLDFTIVRPAGYKSGPVSGNLQIYPENTLSMGEVSRDLVANVCVDALFNSRFQNQVVEIVEGMNA